MVQALRRDVELRRTPIAAALGVAASVYTHQIANARRVLTDVRVRHLLADEVGLGKTIQALMIINALRCQRRHLRVLIIVPDQLVTQWRDEIFTRAHTAPAGEEGVAEGSQFIRLAWEDQLGKSGWSLADIDADRYDVLIVDELHKLTTDVQDRIVRVAPEFEHVLVLTATPAFQHPRRHADAFAILEPERASIARWKSTLEGDGRQVDGFMDESKSKWSAETAEQIVETLLELDRSAGQGCPSEDLETMALTYCAYRRVIRTRRVDFEGVLPRRRHMPVLVDPLGAEVERQALMWRYFGFLDQLSQRFEIEKLAKRVLLSPPSLEQRVDFLRRRGHDREGLLERVKPLVHRRNGDSRADALVDLLREIWAEDVNDRVLVASQDSLTVDYLFDLVQARLPLIGPLEHQIPLVAARVRQGMTTEAVEDLAGFGNETSEHLELFQRGDARVLFAPEAAQVGLNLQCARILVLYSVPWRPEEVEQWIGRLDRIGNVSAFSVDGVSRTIDVYTIAQWGLVDEKVVNVLERFRVFERGVNLDGDHLEEVSTLIEASALRPEKVNWPALEARTEAMAVEDSGQELDSFLRPYLPWSAAVAIALRRCVDTMPPVDPVLVKPHERPALGPAGWDRAFEANVRLLNRSGEYNVRRNADPTGQLFQTLWYQFGEPEMYGARPVLSRVVFSCGADPSHERNPKHAHAFITRRGDIGIPPRRSVTLALQGQEHRRPLHFLGFGNEIHDELIAGWLPRNRPLIPSVDVLLFEDHEFLKRAEAGHYMLRVTTLIPTEILDRDLLERHAVEAIAGAAPALSGDRLIALMTQYRKRIRCALEADIRWISGEFTAELRIEGLHLVDGVWTAVPTEDLYLLLNPLAHMRPGVPRSMAWELLREDELGHALALNQLRANVEGVASFEWAQRLDKFERNQSMRRRVLEVEGVDATELRMLEMQNAEAKLIASQSRGNRAQISRAENDLTVSACKVEMETAFWAQRDAWLRCCGAGIRKLRPQEQLTSAIRVRRGP